MYNECNVVCKLLNKKGSLNFIKYISAFKSQKNIFLLQGINLAIIITEAVKNLQSALCSNGIVIKVIYLQ